MSIGSIGSASSQPSASAIAAAQKQLQIAQQKLAADAAAKSSQTTIAADQMAVLTAQLAVTEASDPTSTYI
jgi:hypothetical protein